MKHRLLILFCMTSLFLRGSNHGDSANESTPLLLTILNISCTTANRDDIFSPRDKKESEDKTRTAFLITSHNKKVGDDDDLRLPKFVVDQDGDHK